MFNWKIDSNVTGESLIEICIDENRFDGVAYIFCSVHTSQEYTGKAIAEVVKPLTNAINHAIERAEFISVQEPTDEFPDGYIQITERFEYAYGKDFDRYAEFNQEFFRIQVLLSRLATKFACQIDLALANEEIEDLMR